MKLNFFTILSFSMGFSLASLIAHENVFYVDPHGVASQADSEGMITRHHFFDGNAAYLEIQQKLERNRVRYEARLEHERKEAEKSIANQNKTEVDYDVLFRPVPIDPIYEKYIEKMRIEEERLRREKVKNIPSECYDLNNLRLKDDHEDWYLTGLSIDGGGIRGLIPASILAKIEEHLPAKKGIAEMFDAVGGISIGGILTLGLTVPSSHDSSRAKHSAADMVDLFRKRGKEIFPIPSWGKTVQKANQLLFTCGYPAEPLEKLLQEYLGNTHISDALTNILVGAVQNNSQNSSNSEPYKTYFFKSFEAGNNPWQDYLSWQVARSTSAAPSYFPHYPIRPDFIIAGGEWSSETLVKKEHEKLMVDGGLETNNPGEEIINYIQEIMKRRFENLNKILIERKTLLLSLGTGLTNLDKHEVLHEKSSAARAAGAVIAAEMSLKSRSIHEKCYERLGKNYYRLDPKIDAVMDLADVSEENLDLLEKSTDQYQEFCEEMARRLTFNKDSRNALDLAPL